MLMYLNNMEERMITLFKRMDTLDGEQSAQARRLTLIESRVGSNGQSLRFAERLFWIIATAAVGLIFFKIRSGGRDALRAGLRQLGSHMGARRWQCHGANLLLLMQP